MAFVTAGRNGTFEVRESRLTPSGPRSRTLATFRELDPATIEKVIARADKPLSREELVRAALRSGATVLASPVDEAARALLRSIARGEEPNRKLHRLLRGALSGHSSSAEEWLGTSLAERGDALRDLLLLADAVPVRARPKEIGFPRLDSTRGSS
ncbi:MAG TPA: hypothetical protein VHB53_12085 [Solirubrobacterales bacterium]|nr:hypothetical protein [Solirubrobacterales bacterium]